MGEIPEDVMRAAREATAVCAEVEGLTDLAGEIRSDATDTWRGLWDVKASARAILAERERCAKIAEAENARLRALLAKAGEALAPFGDDPVTALRPDVKIRPAVVGEEDVQELRSSHFRAARTVAREIEEALK